MVVGTANALRQITACHLTAHLYIIRSDWAEEAAFSAISFGGSYWDDEPQYGEE